MSAKNFDEVKKSVTSSRRKIISELRQIFAPMMWESGYQTGKIGESRPLKLWTPKDTTGNVQRITFHGYKLNDIYGISEFGVITDIYGGGLVNWHFSEFPIEDLIMLYSWALKIKGSS